MNNNLIKGDFLIRCLKGLDFKPSTELKATPGVTWDNDENHVWYVAFFEDRMVACCGMFVKNRVARFKTDVVLPEFRGQGLYRMLFDMRQTYAINCSDSVTTFSNEQSRHMYVKNGFTAKGTETDRKVLYMGKTFDKPVKQW